MTINGSTRAILCNHACEAVLFALLAAPVLALRPSLDNVVIVAGFFIVYFGLSYVSDVSTRLHVDDEGFEYLAGGRDRVFVPWHEAARIVPRRFRAWPAEDAVVILDAAGDPLLVAGVSMFDPKHLRSSIAIVEQHAEVTDPVILSPLTGRANGRRHPELVPQRTSERFLASSIGGFLAAAVIAVTLVAIVEG